MNKDKETASEDEKIMTKRQIKKAYLDAEIGLSDALYALVMDHGMVRGDALKYLGL